MYLKRVTLKNIRGFHGDRRVDLDLTRPDRSYAGWTVLAGRNGSGKTTLLRAIALAIAGPTAASRLIPDFEDWVSHRTSGGTATVELVPDPAVDLFGTHSLPDLQTYYSEQTDPLLTGLAWMWTQPIADRSGKQVRRRQLALTAVDPESSERNQLGPWIDLPAGWFCAGYGPFRRLMGGAADVQRLMQSDDKVARLAGLFFEDASLAEGVSWLIDQHLRTLEKREGALELRTAALAILGDGLLPDDYQIMDVDSDGLWIEHGGSRFPLREMSDGYRSVAALVVDILKQLWAVYGEIIIDDSGGKPVIRQPGIILIDEVDAHLHVSWQKRIGGWLKTHFPAIQFIVTTHSPYICQAADPGGLIRLPGPDERRGAEIVAPELYDRIVFGSGEDVVLSDLFGLDTPYSEQADAVRAELVALEREVVTGRASAEQIERHRELTILLTSSPSARVEEVAARLYERSQADS
ncbi:AAA ATPase [Catenulispora acidiphila DSM 44928]|uniref:AAA ATPase n=1 Tax=Catenulispora acidiphila (strain DSM 44928 / JCM 14897 / NBRC 102108 / NRRL B-24433 / ID139908) TaxID=479433 RepID=C7QAN9_CATAD|nr:AAA family ATPase [Catenulispora acidiphila]ACU74362.1 AAA ATPase [Catenulispora acidiphila DSM 44928]